MKSKKQLSEKDKPPIAQYSVKKAIIPDNPQHKEDFNSLVAVATKTKKQDDKT